MATWKRAQLEIEGRMAFYETEVTLNSGEIVGPALVIEMTGIPEAEEVAETLTRSWAQRKREKKADQNEKPPEGEKPTGPPEPATGKEGCVNDLAMAAVPQGSPTSKTAAQSRAVRGGGGQNAGL